MRFVVSVGNYINEGRLLSFLEAMSITRGIDNAHIFVTNTGRQIYSDRLLSFIDRNRLNVDIHGWRIDCPVPPSQQMHLRLADIEAFCDKDANNTIICNFDDDYHFNPYWLTFAERVFEENPKVNYLTLLKMIPKCCVNVVDDHITGVERLSGFNFAKVKSTMGGSFMARWNTFATDMHRFFEKHGTEGQYDGDFWHIIESEIYMLYDFSLYQHCDLTSQYGHHPHAYGIDYDPICDPFDVSVR